MTSVMDFVDAVGREYALVGRPVLEGRFVAVLLTHGEPLSLTLAAQMLGVSKPALCKVALPMLERGDVKREVEFSSRAHLYSLTDHAYTRDLRAHINVSRQVALLTDALLEHRGGLHPEALSKLRSHAQLSRRAADALEAVVAPEEEVQDAELREHLEENWDALPPEQGGQRVQR